MPSVRLMSPQQLFKDAMSANVASTSQGRGTITKGEAEKAATTAGRTGGTADGRERNRAVLGGVLGGGRRR